LYRWELEELADQQLASLPRKVRRDLATFMDAVVIVDPMAYLRAPGEPLKPLRQSSRSERCTSAPRKKA